MHERTYARAHAKQWHEVKHQINKGPLVLWLAVRIIMMAMFHIIVMDHLPSDIIIKDSHEASTESPLGSDLVIQNVSQQEFCHGASDMVMTNISRYIILSVAIAHCVFLIIMEIWEIISSRSADQRMILSGKQSERLMYLINITRCGILLCCIFYCYLDTN